MFVENATTLDRQVAAWLVIAATAFYLRGRRPATRAASLRLPARAAAVLADYSAATTPGSSASIT